MLSRIKKSLLFSDIKKPPVLKTAQVLSIQNGEIPEDFKMKGLKVFSWKEFLKNQDSLGKEWREKIFKALNEKRDSLSSVNNVFSREGLILLVEDSLKIPLEIQFLQESFSKRRGLPFRLFVFVQENCRADIFETFYGGVFKDKRTVRNSEALSSEENSIDNKHSFLFHLQTDCFLEKGSALNYIRLDQGQERDVCFNQLFGSLDEEAEGSFLTVSLRSGLSRYETSLKQKRKSRSEVRGLSLVDKRRLVEHRVLVSHLEGESFSNQLYQSLIFDSAKHIFRGLIHIAREAQKLKPIN